MNKTVVAVLLLGLIVVAMAAEGKDKKRIQKDKTMAKKLKVRVHLNLFASLINILHCAM